MDQFWNGKHVLVTGATGLVGSWLVKALLENQARVIVLVRDTDPQSELVRTGLINKTTVVNGALEDYFAVERAINEHEVDTIFHLGAQTIVGTALRSPLPTFESNIRGSYNLLEACRQLKGLVKRIVVASSDKAYGTSPELPYTEEMPLRGEHPYDVSKSCTDLLALSYAKTYQLPVTIARCGNIFGGGDLNWSRIVPGTIKSLYNEQAPEIRSNGLFTRDYIYIRDVVDAYMTLAKASDREDIRGQGFNFGPNRPYNVLEVVDAIQSAMNCKHLKPRVLNQAKAEIQDQTLCSKKAERILNWKPSYTLEQGLKETIKWYEDYLEASSPRPKNEKTCRFCQAPLKHSFCDLGKSPISNSYPREEDLTKKEPFFPLHAYVCDKCFLVQLEEFQTPDEIFSNDYAYFSSYSDTWLKHCKKYVDEMIQRFGYNKNSQVIEIASNDGYLLKYFHEKQIPVLGIEPATNVAAVAQKAGINTLVKFFGVKTASELVKEGKKADLLLGNNVLAHVPQLNDFVEGMKLVLKPDGVITMEFPHLLRLMEENQFDTIYHEHFSYLSFLTVERVFASHGLTLFDVEELPTHGGSLRIFGKHTADQSKPISPRVKNLKDREKAYGLDKIETYQAFNKKVEKTRESLLKFLEEAKKQGKKVVAYGAPAKGNTLLNYCGVNKSFIEYTVDRSPHKQGRYLPGTHIPIKDPEMISRSKPDYLLILPWNIKEEIMQQMAHIRTWGGKFVTPIPDVEVIK